MVSSSTPSLPLVGWLILGAGQPTPPRGRTGSGIPPAGVGVLRFGVDLMALTASQALDDSRRYVS